ncbi:hypothetical protein ACRAWD_12840 [Caulobacter segnis]
MKLSQAMRQVRKAPIPVADGEGRARNLPVSDASETDKLGSPSHIWSVIAAETAHTFGYHASKLDPKLSLARVSPAEISFGEHRVGAASSF